jgi:hypothetical protein
VGILIGGKFVKKMSNANYTTNTCCSSPLMTCHTKNIVKQLYVLERLLPPSSLVHAKAGTEQAKISLRLLSKKKIVYGIASTTAVTSALRR